MYAFALYSVTYFAYVQCINSLLFWLTITGLLLYFRKLVAFKVKFRFSGVFLA